MKNLENFLEKLGIKAEIEFVGYDCPRWSIHQHKHYKATFSIGKNSHTVDFWDSIVNSYRIRFENDCLSKSIQNYIVKGIRDGVVKEDVPLSPNKEVGAKKFYCGGNYKRATLVKNQEKPTIENILDSCELTEPDLSFDDFCDEFGYSNDSIKALEIHRAVLEQYSGLRKVFGEDGLNAVIKILHDIDIQ